MKVPLRLSLGLAYAALVLYGPERAGADQGGHLPTIAGTFQRQDLILVKMRDGSPVRASQGLLVETSPGGFGSDSVKINDLHQQGVRWERAYAGIPEIKLNDMRQAAEAALGRAVPDQNLEFVARVPQGLQGIECARQIAELGAVEWAEAAWLPAAAPSLPDFEGNQGYRTAPPLGMGIAELLGVTGADGSGVKFADIEYSWNLSHQDLFGATRIGPAPIDPFNNDNHGTAVLGQVIGADNGFGVTGLAPGVEAFVVAANTSSGYSIANAVNVAAAHLGPGDVILIEQQAIGPNYTGVPAGTQLGMVPPEWQRAVYNAVLTAVGNGIVVVTAGGNGAQNLDDAVYGQWHNPTHHRPFLAQNDSGSIIVGAGAADPGTTVPRSRLAFSNYGSRINLQGWGERVWTTGFGDAYSAGGRNLYYTGGFLGTSSAAAMVAGAAACLQSAYRSQTGLTLSPAMVRSCLMQTGAPQQTGTNPSSQNIGPLPNVPAALQFALESAPLPPGSFQLTEPNNGAVVQQRSVTLAWTQAIRATSYRVLLSASQDLSAPILDVALEGMQQALAIPQSILAPGGAYHWTVRALNSHGEALADPSIGSFVLAVSQCTGDADGDGLVRFSDVASVLLNWSALSELPDASAPGDATGDGMVDLADIAVILVNWGTVCP